MKINYTTALRARQDLIKIVLDIEGEAEPVIKRGIAYQPVAIEVEFQRELRRATHMRDRLNPVWMMTYSIQGKRVLKAGGLGQQSQYLWFGDDHPAWVDNATKLAKEEFDKILTPWPDHTWSEESLQSP